MKAYRGTKGLDYYAALPYTIILEQHNDAAKPYWVARVAELPHCLIHGETPEQALAEIRDVMLDWIQSNLEDGLPVPEPAKRKFSGEIRLRMPPSLHQHIAMMAQVEDVSLNQYMIAALARSTGYDEGAKTTKKSEVNVAP